MRVPHPASLRGARASSTSAFSERRGVWGASSGPPARILNRLRIEATDRGVARIAIGRGPDRTTPGGRRHAARARRQLREYLAGRRRAFTVALDLRALPPFQSRVLAEARRIPFGRVASFAALARRIGRPRAPRAVGRALAENPVPILVPCHRVIRSDGTWGPYGLGGPAWKTRLLALEGHGAPRGRRPRARAW